MFRGWVLGELYITYKGYKNVYNKAVSEGKIFDKNGRKVTKML